MDPVTAGLAISAASAGASTIGAYRKAKGEQERAKINSFIGRTRAIQENTVSRAQTLGDMGQLRATFGANQQRPGVGTLEVVNELRRVRDRERRIGVGNRMSEAADWQMQARNAGKAANGALFTGALRTGASLFDLYSSQGGG